MNPASDSAVATDRIEDRATFEQVRYANCWEDADLVCESLQPAPGKRILSIASAGDNALALLAEGATVVVADISAAQLACLEFRVAAFRHLDHATLLALLGVRPCDDRLSIYATIESDLSEAARQHWQANPDAIAGGIIHAGRFENYFRLFRKRVLPLIHRRKTIDELMREKTRQEQATFYDQRWNNQRWRILFRLFFGRMMLGNVGRDPEFMRYVEGSVGDRLLSRVRHGLREVPTHSNPYLTYILNGNFCETLPRYLRAEHFDAIRNGLHRLIIFHGPIEQAAAEQVADGFDGFNLSDIFEYIDGPSSRDLYAKLISTANPGAVLAYWNTLVARHCPDDFKDSVVSLDEKARELHARDRAFFYCDFVLDQYRPPLEEIK